MLTERQIENRIRRIQALEEQKKAIEEQIDAYKDQLKEELDNQQVEELATPHFIIRWKVVVSNRLDTAALKTKMPEIYKTFLKTSNSRRFTIN